MKQMPLFAGGSVAEVVEERPQDAPPRPDLRRPEQLAEWLSAQVGRPVTLAFTDNRTTLLSYKEVGDGIRLRLQRFFVEATDEVLEALAVYLATDDKSAGRLIDAFVTAMAEQMKVVPREVRPKGRFHDLGELLTDLNAQFFHGECKAQVTWGQAGSRRYRRSIQLGSYSSQEKLIRIHPCLDQAFVPRNYVAWVVFHEMLHEVFGVERGRGRRTIHPPEFSVIEQTFPGYRECKQWEADNLHRLLRYRQPKAPARKRR